MKPERAQAENAMERLRAAVESGEHARAETALADYCRETELLLAGSGREDRVRIVMESLELLEWAQRAVTVHRSHLQLQLNTVERTTPYISRPVPRHRVEVDI